MKSRPSPSFWRSYRRLPVEVRRQAYLAYRRWLETPNLPGLRFKLVDANERLYSVRINDNYRALGRMVDDTIIWYFIGTHDEYMRSLNS